MLRIYNLGRQLMHRAQSSRLGLTAIKISVILIAALFLTVGIEHIQRGSFGNVVNWANSFPPSFYMNAFIICLVLLLLSSLVGSILAGVSISTLLLLLAALVSRYKSRLLGEPLMPWDLLLNKEAMNIVPRFLEPSMYYQIGLIVAISLAWFGLRLLLPRLSIKPRNRVVLGVLSSFMLVSLTYQPAWTGNVAERLGIPDINWNPSQNYDVNGAMLAFAMNVKKTIIAKPSGYDQNQIDTIAAGLASPTTEGRNVQGEAKPNVIFIMSESLWDPTLLPDISFSEDPLSTLRELQQTAVSSTLLSPQFGGGTSNVEFEVLTGLSMSQLPAGSNAYQQYIGRPIPSLASYFSDLGYKSMAIHSYEGWFWNRVQVYPLLGFQSFMSKEFFVNPEYKGGFIADDEVARSIIRQVEQTEEPVFLYAVTMQNHSPYETSRYYDYPIDIQGNLTSDARDLLNTYVRGVQDADQSLKLLIDYFSAAEEPTYIVFFGDHLPTLGYEYDVYFQGGLIQSRNSAEWSLEEMLSMHSTPLIIWSNVPSEMKIPPVLSSSSLGAYMLDMLQFEKPAFWAANEELNRQLPGMINGLAVDSERNLYAGVPPSLLSEVDRYSKLQYDLLFGKQFFMQTTDPLFQVRYPVENYNKELTHVELREVENSEAFSNFLRMTLKGVNFYDEIHVLINGKKVKPLKLDDETLELDIPNGLLKDQKKLSIQLQQLDSRNIVLSESNVITFEASW
ncbi:MAG: sulfatase [Paenibacillus sp.]|nr:sulfatase [Paenibacillus sp.]